MAMSCFVAKVCLRWLRVNTWHGRLNVSGGRLGKRHILALWQPHWDHDIVISRGNEQR